MRRVDREFGLHLKKGGWRLGLLVARSVAPGDESLVGSNQHRERVAPNGATQKVSATRFAELAGPNPDGTAMSENRVLRYYRGWERAAEAGKVPHADDLHPGEDIANATPLRASAGRSTVPSA